MKTEALSVPETLREPVDIVLNTAQFLPGEVPRIRIPGNPIAVGESILLGRTGFVVEHYPDEIDEEPRLCIHDALASVRIEEDDSRSAFFDNEEVQTIWNKMAEVSLSYDTEIGAHTTERPLKLIFIHRGYPLTRAEPGDGGYFSRGLAKILKKESESPRPTHVIGLPLSTAKTLIDVGFTPDAIEIWATRRDEPDFLENQKIVFEAGLIPDPESGVARLSGNKLRTKAFLSSIGLTVPEHALLEDTQVDTWVGDKMAESDGGQTEFIVKPNTGNNGEGVCLVNVVGDGEYLDVHLTYPDKNLAHNDKTYTDTMRVPIGELSQTLHEKVTSIGYPYSTWIMESRIPDLPLEGVEGKNVEFRYNIYPTGEDDPYAVDTLCRITEGWNYRANTCAGAETVTLDKLGGKYYGDHEHEVVSRLYRVQQLFGRLVVPKLQEIGFDLDSGISFDVRPDPHKFNAFLASDHLFEEEPSEELIKELNDTLSILEVQALGTLSAEATKKKTALLFTARANYLEILRSG